MDIQPSEGSPGAGLPPPMAPPPTNSTPTKENGASPAQVESPVKRPWPNEREDYELKEVIGRYKED